MFDFLKPIPCLRNPEEHRADAQKHVLATQSALWSSLSLSKSVATKFMQQSNVLVYLILFFGVLNVIEALLIWLGSPWSKQAIGLQAQKSKVLIELTIADSSVLEPVYRESINTVRRPLYPEWLYDASLTAWAVDEIVVRYATDQKIIALPRSEKLLRSIPFPWNSTMNALALAGYHSLHSIVGTSESCCSR